MRLVFFLECLTYFGLRVFTVCINFDEFVQLMNYFKLVHKFFLSFFFQNLFLLTVESFHFEHAFTEKKVFFLLKTE